MKRRSNTHQETMNTAAPSYRLGELTIELTDSPDWARLIEAQSGQLDRLSGRVTFNRQLDILVLHPWALRGPDPSLKSLAEARAALAALPLWSGSRWALQWDDFGQASLLDCRTGQLADPNNYETEAACAAIRKYIIRTKPFRVVLKVNNCASKDPCDICGERTDPNVGPEFFLDHSWGVVCHRCAEEHAPELIAVYKHGIVGHPSSAQTAAIRAAIRSSAISTKCSRIAIKVNNAATTDPCAICGGQTDPRIGPEPFLEENMALVCHRCAEKHSPDLMAVYKHGLACFPTYCD